MGLKSIFLLVALFYASFIAPSLLWANGQPLNFDKCSSEYSLLYNRSGVQEMPSSFGPIERHLLAQEFSADGRPILIISDTQFKQRTGVVTLMENIERKVHAATDGEVHIVFVTPAGFSGIDIPGQSRRASLVSQKQIGARIEDINPQAIHIMVEGALGNAAKRYLTKNGIPFTTSYTTNFAEYARDALNRYSTFFAKKAQGVVTSYLKKFHRDSQGILVATETMARRLENLGYDPKKIRYWSRGVDTKLFHPGKADPALFQGLPRPISIYTGRVAIEKNIEDFLRMRVPGTKVVIGEGPELARLQKKYPQVVFVGRLSQEDTAKHMASGDVFVFPSTTDTFGQVQLEANASGMRVVAYKVPGPQDVVKSPDSGQLADFLPNETESNIYRLEAAWKTVHASPKEGPRAWAERWSWSNAADQFLYYLRRIPGSPQSEFGASFGPEFVEAEQELIGTTPWLSHPTKTAGLFFPSLKFTGTLDKWFTPGGQKVFLLPSVLVPIEEMKYVGRATDLSGEMAQNLFVEKDGKTFVRFFMHPTETDTIAKMQAKYERDPQEWIATPGSSGRTLMVKNRNGDGRAFQLKSSISQNMGRYKRTIDDERAVRAVALSSEIGRIHEESGGKLPSGKSWDFFREPVSLIPDLENAGGMIAREIPEDMGKDITLSWYSLVAKRKDKRRWIDELFGASQKGSMDEFIWEDLVKPLDELHNLLSIQNGLTTELHQQNVMIVVDRETKRVKGIRLRDMDAHFVDHSLRVHRLGKSPITAGGWDESLYLFRYGQAQANQYKSYIEKLRMESIQWIMKYALPKSGVDALLKKSDQLVVDAFNEQFPDFAVKDISGLEDAWIRLHASVTTPEEAASYQAISKKTEPNLFSRLLNGLRDRSARRGIEPGSR